MIHAHRAVIARKRASASEYLLDKYPGASAAYSLRQLLSTYTSDVVLIRRSGDNAELGFTPSEINDGTLASWVTAGGGDEDGFVVTWYDQSGVANNATQVTAGNQPQIVDAGALIAENGKPAIKFLADEGTFSIASPILSQDSNNLITMVINAYTYNTGPWIRIFGIRDDSENINYQIGLNSDTNELFIRRDASSQASNDFSSTVLNNQLILSYGASSDSNYIAGDGVSLALELAGPTGNSIIADDTAAFPNGYYEQGAYCMTIGTFQELIIYDTDKLSSRAGIETNINSYYGVY